MRRLFWMTLGATVGVLAVRRATRAAQRLTPASLQTSLAASVAGLGDALREFSELVREGMAEREQELHVSLGLDGTHDLVDTVPGYTGGLEPDVR